MIRQSLPITALVLLLAACGASTEKRAASGAGIGAATGAAVGAATDAGVTEGAIIGGAAGAIGGAVTDEEDIDLGDIGEEDEAVFD
ncbi:MAG: hypothetical protein R3310_02820 [Candidatus Competibacteraceae bacterium]|nr:hypothetical protein [Candidatus Competibacteraceae bacterium]